ncbi:MAG: MutS-related protein [Spirochaetaceae bacterium]
MSCSALSRVSLLEPEGHSDASYWNLPEQVCEDLNLEEITRAVTSEGSPFDRVARVLGRLPVDPGVSRYRQEILKDLREVPGLREAMAAEVSGSRELLGARYSYSEDLLETVGRLTELELFLEGIRGFADALGSRREQLTSRGLRRFDEALQEATADATFRAMEEELPGLRKGLRNRRSLTVGINLDDKMRPQAATLLSVNEKPFDQATSLQRLLSLFTPEGAATPLHTNDLPESLRRSDGSAPALSPLFRDLEELLRSIVRPVARALRSYAYVQTETLGEIASELSVYLGVLSMADALEEQGLWSCEAELLDAEEPHPSCDLTGVFALSLTGSAGAHAVVANDFQLNSGEALVILTGPNSGGKTTYLRAVAQAQFLGQHGFPVPARRARLTPVPGMLSLFTSAEGEGGTMEGRLAQELRRLSQMVSRAPRGSLYFFNEAFSSTGTDDAVEIAETVLKAIIDSGGRVLFATHLHALAGKRDEIARDLPGAEVVNLVAQSGEEGPTYSIERGEPEGRSYAARLVREYGLDYQTLRNRLEGQ